MLCPNGEMDLWHLHTLLPQSLGAGPDCQVCPDGFFSHHRLCAHYCPSEECFHWILHPRITWAGRNPQGSNSTLQSGAVWCLLKMLPFFPFCHANELLFCLLPLKIPKTCICWPQILPGFGLNHHLKWIRDIFVLCVRERVGRTLFIVTKAGTGSKAATCYTAFPQKHSTNCHFSHWIPERSSAPSAKAFLALHPASQLPFSQSALDRISGLWSFVHLSAKGGLCWKFRLNLANWEIFVTLH